MVSCPANITIGILERKRDKEKALFGEGFL
jgi:hypothetical protein